MKRIVILILLLSSIAFSQKKEELQRFQIIEVENIFINTPAELFPFDLFVETGKEKSLMKVDTQTGEAWILVFEFSKDIKNLDSLGTIHHAVVPKWFKIENFSWNLPPLPIKK